MREIEDAITLANSVPKRGLIKDWYELVATKANRRRMFIISALVIGIDWCGTSVTSYYVSWATVVCFAVNAKPPRQLSKILTSVGISSSTQQTGIVRGPFDRRG